MAILREAPVDSAAAFTATAEDAAQRERALAGLVADGLVEADGSGYRLPR
jgi:A/G-specific adenine glycosylase